MAKDAKGHGSEKRGGGTYENLQVQRYGASAHSWFGPAEIARAQRGAKQIAEAHGLPTQHLGPGGPVKVQSLDTKRVGQPWATRKAYGNRTVAETVAKGLRVDEGKGTKPGGFMRIRVK